MSETNVMLVIPEEKDRIQGKTAYIRTGLTVEQLILKLMLFATQDKPVMIVEKEADE